MGGPLRRNTSATRNIGPFIDDTDFKSLENLLTIADTEVRISKNGGAYGPATGSVIAFNENGFYDCTFAAANVDTGGSLDVQVLKAGVLIAYDTFTVYTEPMYDLFFAGTSTSIDANVVSYIGTAITETTSGNYATNSTTFWDNSNTITTKTVDDVGSSVITGPVSTFSTGSTVTTGTENGVHTNTHASDGVYWGVTDTGTGILAELQYNINGGVGEPMKDLSFILRYQAGGNREMNIDLYNYNTAGFDTLRTIISTGVNYDTVIFTELDADYTDTNGDVRVQFNTTTNQNGDFFSVDLGKAVYYADIGSVPSAQEIAVETEALLASLHGRDIWNGLDFQQGDIVSVTNQTTFVLDDGPNQDDVFNGGFLIVRSATFPTNVSGTYITDWDQGTRTVTIAKALNFTVQANDEYRVVANPPVNVDAIRGTLLTETTIGRIANNISTFFDNGDAATAKIVDNVGDILDTVSNKTLIQIAMNELAVDTLTFEDFLNIGLSVFAGKFIANTSTGDTTFYRQNESDQTISINTSAVGSTTTRLLNSYIPPAP